jgi:phospholipid/cholesterol/gamma-HCH transport system substrate-binding protein
MITRSQKYRLGIFIALSTFLLIVLLVIIGTEQFLKQQDIYYIAYKDISVSGLEIGSPVKYLGLGVGTIRDIEIDPEDISSINVKIAIKPGTPIKKDAYADIELLGITGLKMIEIRGGSNEAELLEPGAFIPPGGSTSEMITGKAEIIAEKIELLVNNLNRFTQPENLDKIIRLAESSNRTFEDLDLILNENRNNLNKIMAHTQTTIAQLDSITEQLVPVVSRIRETAMVDTISDILANVNQITYRMRKANLEYVIDELARTINRTHQLLTNVDHDLERGSANLYISLRRLRSTLEYLDETARMINEDPSILLRGTEYEDLPDDDLDR